MGFSSTATLANNIVAENQIAERLSGDGADCGLYIDNSSPTLLHTTIARNTGGLAGTGVCMASWFSPSRVVMSDTILVSHTVGLEVRTDNEATLEATMWGSGAWANGTDWTGAGTINHSTDIWGDPAFVDPDAGDYHIGEGSAARDAGVNAGVTTDIDGQARPQGAGYDIGADEWYPAAECREDVNDDGVINIVDIQMVAAGWGGADPNLDMEPDGDVDIDDILQVAGRWRESC